MLIWLLFALIPPSFVSSFNKLYPSSPIIPKAPGGTISAISDEPALKSRCRFW
jgi:hypothetical protein